ncbi:MAG: glycosyltransferase family 2 protein [Paludibacteraceae bacterium]|nr:glycosyltransferase family 2 protein [Paludibacteraceae bacterium]
MKEEQPILVAVWCLVYNHEPYLRDCFEGFVKQKTNFRYVAVVHDDVSTDNSAAIIREYAEKYPDIFRPIYETENQWSKLDGSIEKIMCNAIEELGAKYVALCEGDDYWTDPYKLQKQVDFLENHLDYTICFHRLQCLKQATGEVVDEYMVRDMQGKSSVEDLATENYIHTPSVVYRLIPEVMLLLKNLGHCLPGDYVMWMLLADKGMIWKMEDSMAIYRVGSGIWSTSQSYRKELMIIKTLSKLYVVITNPQAKQHLAEAISRMSESNITYVGYLERQLNQIQHSKAYRLSKAILKPFKWMKRKF